MLLGEIISVALGALRANKLRSALTMLGIVIGVAAVIAMVALGTGAQKAVQERIAALGTTLITVRPGQQRGFGVVIADQQTKLTMQDAAAIEERAPHVVGVLESKGQAMGFMNPDDQILIPLNTARFRVHGTDRLRAVSALASSEDKIPDAMADIQKVLRREHRLRQGQPDDFQMQSQADFLNTLGETTQVFTFLLSGIAAVSLLVGGIGIMNIMLVSVTERTREIGVRKALGATRRNILLQFLIEAVVLCLFGGGVGVLLGASGATVMSHTAGWNTQVSPAAVGLAFAFSALVGVLFGVWPARRAASLD